MRWISKLYKKEVENLDEFSIVDKVLPDFPSFKATDESIWRIIDKDKRLNKICGELKPSTQIGVLFTARHSLDTRMDGECYPTYSPITINIKRI